MNQQASIGATTSVPVWFWLLAIAGLLWYLMDASVFYMRVFGGDMAMANVPENQQMLYKNMPSWVNVVFALEVFGGLLGCIGLLLRKKWALPLFIVSLIGVLCQSFYIWFLSDAVSVMGNMAIIMPVVAIVITLVLIMLSRRSIGSGWLR